MSAKISYFRVSTKDQSIEVQRQALGGEFNKEFSDEGVSGAILASERPGFAELLKFVREGDTIFVYAVDRLGRDSIDVQTNVRDLQKRGVGIHVHGLGMITGEMGSLILTLLAQFAQMERSRILARCESGREIARESIAKTGKTRKGAESLGRKFKAVASEVKAWREANNATIAKTADHFQVGESTVKRYCSIQ